MTQPPSPKEIVDLAECIVLLESSGPICQVKETTKVVTVPAKCPANPGIKEMEWNGLRDQTAFR